LGKIFGIFIMLSGVALLALPAGIITSGFLDELKNVRKPKSHTCPHCGMPLDDAQTGASHHHEKQ